MGLNSGGEIGAGEKELVISRWLVSIAMGPGGNLGRACGREPNTQPRVLEHSQIIKGKARR